MSSGCESLKGEYTVMSGTREAVAQKSRRCNRLCMAAGAGREDWREAGFDAWHGEP
jgi:hypothetical protein